MGSLSRATERIGGKPEEPTGRAFTNLGEEPPQGQLADVSGSSALPWKSPQSSQRALQLNPAELVGEPWELG